MRIRQEHLLHCPSRLSPSIPQFQFPPFISLFHRRPPSASPSVLQTPIPPSFPLLPPFRNAHYTRAIARGDQASIVSLLLQLPSHIVLRSDLANSTQHNSYRP